MPDPLPRAGLTAGEFIGYRVWELHKLNDELTIRSWVYPCFWIPGQIISDISYQDGCTDSGPIGDYNNRGIWAYKTEALRDKEFLNNFIYTGNLVWGTCWQWGTIIEHELGYRSQYARIRTIDSASGYGIETLEWLRNKYNLAAARL